MKKILLILAVSLVLFTACEKNDVPSLDEQMQGRWQIESYREERYDPAANTVTRSEFDCGPKDYMDFIAANVFVHFDSTGTEKWTCTIFDHNTLLIEGKKWDIVELSSTNFQISSAERDSTLKQRDVVAFELVRP